jgi:O-antigen/teichoic acid export membrane protein
VKPAGSRPFLRRIILNTAMTAVSNGWTIVATVISLPFVLHGLGPRVYAWWVLLQIMSASTGVLAILDAGFATAVTRTVATRASVERERLLGRVVGTSLTLFSGLAIAGAAGVALVAAPVIRRLGRVPPSAGHDLRVAVNLLILQVFAELALQGCESCLEGLQRVDLSRSVDMIRRAIIAGGTAWAATATHRLAPTEAAVAGATGFALVLCALALWWESRGNRLGWSTSELRGMLSYAKSIVLLRPISALYQLMDRVIVAAVLGPSAVPLVDIADQVESGVSVVLSSVSYSLLPGAAWLQARGDRERLRTALEDGTRFTLLVTWCLALGIGMLADPGIRVWLGGRFASVAGPVRVAMGAMALSAIAQVAGNILFGIGKAGLILRASVVGVAVDLAVSVALVHPLGISGVFWGTVCGSLVTVPWIFGSTARLVDRPAARLFVESAVPTLMALLLEVVGISAALITFDRPLERLLVGAALGGAGAAFGIARWGCRPGELRNLWRTVASRSDSPGEA